MARGYHTRGCVQVHLLVPYACKGVAWQVGLGERQFSVWRFGVMQAVEAAVEEWSRVRTSSHYTFIRTEYHSALLGVGEEPRQCLRLVPPQLPRWRAQPPLLDTVIVETNLALKVTAG